MWNNLTCLLGMDSSIRLRGLEDFAGAVFNENLVGEIVANLLASFRSEHVTGTASEPVPLARSGGRHLSARARMQLRRRANLMSMNIRGESPLGIFVLRGGSERFVLKKRRHALLAL